MYKALNYLTRAARGSLRSSVRENEHQDINLRGLSLENVGEALNTNGPKFLFQGLGPLPTPTPRQSLPTREQDTNNDVLHSRYNQWAFKSITLLERRDCPSLFQIEKYGNDDGQDRKQDRRGYENWTPSEALVNIYMVVLLYNLVHHWDGNEFPAWMCPYINLKNFKSTHAQPLHLIDSSPKFQEVNLQLEDRLTALNLEENYILDEENHEDHSVHKVKIDDETKEAVEESKRAFDRKTKRVRFPKSEFELELDALQGIDMVQEGNPRGIVVLQDLSQAGSSVASFHLGMAYESGYIVDKNLNKAVQYYKQAAKRGNPDAQYNLAVFYTQGWGGLHQDAAKAKQLLKKAAKGGCESAIAALYPSNNHNTNAMPTAESAVGSGLSTPTARGDRAKHLYELGRSFEELGEMGTALEFYTQAAEEGHGKAREARIRINSGSGSA